MSLRTLTEADWLSAHCPNMLLRALGNRASVRKHRLLLATAVRAFWGRLTEAERAAIAAVERFADGATTRADVERYRERAHDPRSEYWGTFDTVVRCAVELDHVAERSLSVCVALSSVYSLAVEAPGQQGRSWQQAADTLSARQACTSRATALILDLFGNPYQPTDLEPGWFWWNGGTMPALAKAINDDRQFDHMPILADALEDAGCTDATVLSHCRGTAEHWRGCWVLDLVLEAWLPALGENWRCLK